MVVHGSPGQTPEYTWCRFVGYRRKLILLYFSDMPFLLAVTSSLFVNPRRPWWLWDTGWRSVPVPDRTAEMVNGVVVA